MKACILKRAVAFVLTFLFILSAGQGLLIPRADATLSDWEIAREEWFLRICGDESNDVGDVRIRRLLDQLDYRAQYYLRIMDTSADANRLFHSSSSDNVAITASGDMTKEYDYLRIIALAYGTYGTKYYRDPDVEGKLLYGLQWLYEHYYGQKQTYGKGADGWHLMTGFNWWDWYIGTPQDLYDIMMVLDHFGLLTAEKISNYLAPVKYIMDDPDAMYRYYVDDDETYDHKVKHIVIMLGYSLLMEDPETMTHLVDDMIFCMQPSPTGNGIREDGSFRFHEYHAMEGTYGADILVNRIIQATGMLHGTSFLDPIGQDALAGQVDWFSEIFAPTMHNGVVLAQSNGRMPQNGIGNGNLIMQGALGLVGLYPEKDEALKKFIWEQMGENNLSSYDLIYYQSVLNHIQDNPPVGEKEQYARTRYTTDRVVQHREDYTVGIALSSNRTIRYECINNCNMKGWYTGDGMLYVYTDKTDQNFDEYGSEYFNNVNMYRLPGTTEDTAPRKEVSISGTYRSALIPKESFVGGVQFDDDYATIAYDFAAYNSKGNESAANSGYGEGNPAVTSDLEAKKAYFLFDNEIVCLGAGITSTNDSDIRTYVDNRQLYESAMVDGTLVYGTEDMTVDGTLLEKAPTFTQVFTDPKSVYVEGFGGYYFPGGGQVTLNKTDGAVPFYELWMDHGLQPTNETYSYVMLPTMDEAEVSAYSQKPEIEILVNNYNYQVVRDVSSGITGYVFRKAGTCHGITVDKPLTVMVRELGGYLDIAVSDPTQSLTTATVTIDQRLYKTSADKEITVTENDLTTAMVIDFTAAGGKSVSASFGQKSTREMLFSFTGTTAEKQSYATATYGGSNFSGGYSWQTNGSPVRPTVSGENGGTLCVDLLEGKDYHWIQITEHNQNLFTHPLQYIPRKDDVVQIRFKLENCTLLEGAQIWFYYVGAEETVDSVSTAHRTKRSFPANYVMGEYVVFTFRDLPENYSTMEFLTAFRFHFYNVVAGADAKLVFDTIYIGSEENAPNNAPIYFDFGGSEAEKYRYTDVAYGSGAYDFSSPDHWAYHTGRTAAFGISEGILSMTVSEDETMGASSWLRPSRGNGGNTEFVLNMTRENIEVAQLRLRITGTLRDNSDIVLYLSRETNKFTTLGVASRELLKTDEFYVLNIPLRKNEEGWYGLLSIDTHNMQGCTLEIDYVYLGSAANAPMTDGLHMDFTNSMSDVYRYHLPQYKDLCFDDSNQWAYNPDRTTRPIVNSQAGTIEHTIKDSQTWLRPSIGKNDSTNPGLSYTPGEKDIFQIHFRVEGYTGANGSLVPSFSDGTKQSNGWFAFQRLTATIPLKLTEGGYMTATVPLTDIAKASSIAVFTLDFYYMAGCKIYIDSIYIGPMEGAPCCTEGHTPVSTNPKAPTCSAEGYTGDSYCTRCGYQTARGVAVAPLSHSYSYTSMDYSHKALCSVCGHSLWEAHSYSREGLCLCGADEAREPTDYLLIDFNNDPEARARYRTYSYCGFNYDTSTCWGYNTLRSTAPMVNSIEESLSFRVIDTTSWVRPSISKRAVGYTNLYFPTSKIQVFQIRLMLQRDALNSWESFSLSYTTGTYNSANGNPVFSTLKTFSGDTMGAIPNGEYVTLTLPLTDYKFPWDLMRGFNLNFNGMKDTTVNIDYIYFGSWERIPSCKEGHSFTLTSVGETGHSRACTQCAFVQTVEHDFTYTQLDDHVYHARTCVCGYSDRTEGHKYAFSQYSPDQHTRTCEKCHFADTSNHIFTYTSAGSEGHDRYCKWCKYEDSVGHDWNAGTMITAPTCTENGSMAYTCKSCGEAKADTVAPMGHVPVYTPLDGEHHLITCANCDTSTRGAHNYTEGRCICGEIEITEPVLEAGWKIGHTLNLASDISVNLAVSKSLLEGFDMSTVYILTEIDTYEGNMKAGTKALTLLPEEQGGYYYFTLTGLTAVHMNDRIRSVLYGTKNGQVYYSPTDDYSITDYAYSQMNKANMPQSLKILCADLLRYGGKAQIFKSYRTDNLADAAMTETQRAYLSDISTVTFGNTNTVLNDQASKTVTWAGKALDLASKVTLKFIFDPTGYTGDVAELTLRLTYLSTDGKEKTVTLTGPEVYNREKNYYAFSFDGLLAAELRTAVSARIYVGNTPLSATLCYSADTYGNNKTGALGDLCRALFAYSDSAKAYFMG